MKLKLIFDPPPCAPYGTRPETHFVKISNRDWLDLEGFANAEGIALEDAFHRLLKEGLKVADAERRARQPERTSRILKFAADVLGTEEAVGRWMSSPRRNRQ